MIGVANHLLKAVGILCLVTNVACAADAPSDFAATATIHADGHDALYRLTLPKEVYGAVTDPQLADLRVFNGADEVVPHAFIPRPVSPASAAALVKLGVFPIPAPPSNGFDPKSIHVLTDNKGAVVKVEVTAPPPTQASPASASAYLIDATTLDTPFSALVLEIASPDDYSGLVQVQASDDLMSWRTVALNTPVLALTRGAERLERRRIEFPASKSKYLRLMWDGMPTGAILTGVSAESAELMGEVPHQWEAVSGTAAKDLAGAYEFDSHAHFPADRLRFELPQSNTIASVQVFSRERSDQPWRLVGRDTVYRLNKKEGELISPPIGVPLNSDRYWRLEFDQRGGGLGAGLPKLVLGWVPQEIAFAARGAPPYILTVGKWHTRQAALDISSLVPGYQRPVDARTPAPPNALLVLATLGPITVTRQLSDQPEDIKNKALQRAALWALLILGVGFIGWMAWRVLDQMRLTKLSVDSQTEELEP